MSWAGPEAIDFTLTRDSYWPFDTTLGIALYPTEPFYIWSTGFKGTGDSLDTTLFLAKATIWADPFTVLGESSWQEFECSPTNEEFEIIFDNAIRVDEDGFMLGISVATADNYVMGYRDTDYYGENAMFYADVGGYGVAKGQGMWWANHEDYPDNPIPGESSFFISTSLLPPAQGVKIKTGGTMSEAPRKIKIGGTFVENPSTKAKVGGVFE